MVFFIHKKTQEVSTKGPLTLNYWCQIWETGMLSCPKQIENGNTFDISVPPPILTWFRFQVIYPKYNFAVNCLRNCLKLFELLARRNAQYISNGFRVTLNSRSRMEILMVGAGNISWLIIFKEIWLILQIPINFSHTFNARFLIHLRMLIMTMHITYNSFFSELIELYPKIQIPCFDEKKFIS